MKKAQIIFMVVMLLVCIFFFTFAQVQRGYAVEAVKQAEIQAAIAREHAKLAEQARLHAEENAAKGREAQANLLETQKALLACKNN